MLVPTPKYVKPLINPASTKIMPQLLKTDVKVFPLSILKLISEFSLYVAYSLTVDASPNHLRHLENDDPYPFLTNIVAETLPNKENVRNNEGIAVFNSNLYLFGGLDWSVSTNSGVSRECFKYDILDNEWHNITPEKHISSNRYRAITTIIGNEYICVLGGECILNGSRVEFGKYSSDVLLLDIATNEWCKLPCTPLNLGIMIGAVNLNQPVHGYSKNAALFVNELSIFPPSLAEIIVTYLDLPTVCAIYTNEDSLLTFIYMDNETKIWKEWWTVPFGSTFRFFEHCIVQDNLTGLTWCLSTPFSQHIHLICLDIERRIVISSEKIQLSNLMATLTIDTFGRRIYILSDSDVQTFHLDTQKWDPTVRTNADYTDKFFY